MCETEQSLPMERRVACDNCRVRKTKCDRKLPCASCVTLNVACRTTRRPTEKKQRVLISSKYDEAVQDMNRQLSDVKQMLQSLLINSAGASQEQTPPSESHHSPPSLINEQIPNLLTEHEGYKGDASFQTHADRVNQALEATLAATEFINILSQDGQLMPPETQARNFPTQSPSLEDAPPLNAVTQGKPPHPSEEIIDDVPLPPLDLTLKLLRLAQVEKQQFFLNAPMFEEEEFLDMCRDVYFAKEPVSIWLWISVNVGLYYLFMQITEESCRRLKTTPEAMAKHVPMLMENAEAAMQCVRLCSEPSLETCRSLASLATYYTKEGHSTIAWRLMSGAARAALDIGLHRLSSDDNDPDAELKRIIFGHIYTWDTWLAFTYGRTPVIPHYDVTLDSMDGFKKQDTILGRIYDSFLDCAMVMARVQPDLFSLVAQHAPQQERSQRARGFADQLLRIRKTLETAKAPHPIHGDRYIWIAMMSDLIAASVLTLVYRVLPPDSIQPHPLQCADECVASARQTLSTLVNMGQLVSVRNFKDWSQLLNFILSVVPFVSFLVIAGNAIATCSDADLELLSSMVALMAPVAEQSPTTRKMHDACERFARLARLIVTNSMTGPPEQNFQMIMPSEYPINASTSSGNAGLMVDGYGLPMTQNGWDSVMVDFEAELGIPDTRALTSVMEPYFTQTG